MVGNFDVDVQHQQRIGHLFGPMPPEMRQRHGVHGPHPLLPARLGRPQDPRGHQDRPLRPGQRFPERVLEPLAWPGACLGVAGAIQLRWRTQRPRPERREQDHQRPAQADPPLPRRGGARRRPGMGRAAGDGDPPPRQGTAEDGSSPPSFATPSSATRSARTASRSSWSRPELQSEDHIGRDPLPPGQVWGISPGGGEDEGSGLFRIEVTEGPGSGVRILNRPAPPAFAESVKYAQQNLYARAAGAGR